MIPIPTLTTIRVHAPKYHTDFNLLSLSHNCPAGQDQDKEYVGFATLPNQVHRKSVKKGFDFTLMVAGQYKDCIKEPD